MRSKRPVPLPYPSAWAEWILGETLLRLPSRRRTVQPMSKYRILWVLVAGSAAWLTSSRVWSDGDDREGFTRTEWATIASLSPLPALPVDTTNKYRDSPAAALLGQKLFFEPGLSRPVQT